MAKLVYSAITSLDGYTADTEATSTGPLRIPKSSASSTTSSGLSAPTFYGRRMYESMIYWENFGSAEDRRPEVRDFAELWRAADKVVYSRTLGAVSSARTRIERAFDPAAVRRMKDAAGPDMSVGGSDLAGQAMAAGLVDEVHLFVTPITVGGGTRALPDGSQTNLDLMGVDRFTSGIVHLHYRIGS